MALDGTRYLAGEDHEPQISFVDRVTVDTADSGPGSVETVADFVGGLRTSEMERLELRWVGPQRQNRACEFSLVVQPSAASWRLYSDFTIGGADHGWTYTFQAYSLTDLTSPAIDDAVSGLLELLDATAAHPVEFHRRAVTEAQSLLGGQIPVPDEVFGIRINDLDDRRARLLAAAVALSAGKLSGMGGFDDAFIPGIGHLDIVSIVGKAIAASTVEG